MLPWFENDSFPLYLAPMAGYTDIAFRSLCKRHGADVVVSEFVMAEALLRGGDHAWEAVDFSEEQRPMGVQIFGAEPEGMAEAARRVLERFDPDFIDINYGCPSPRICKLEAGSSLLKDLPRLGAIAGAVVRAVPEKPVTAKIRIGWDDANIVAAEAGRILEAEGIRALAVHGRTKEQGYRGDARWEVILETAGAVGIPVVGNGSIAGAEDVLRLRDTGLRGLMIGRAALGYPWIFEEIKHTLAHGEAPPPPSEAERWRVILEYARILASRPVKRERFGDTICWMRSRLMSLTKNMRGGKKFRHAIEKISTINELEQFVENRLAASASAAG